VSSINAQIDAAVVAMKARAAEFDDMKTMHGVTAAELIMRAWTNCAKARTIDDVHGLVFPATAREDIVDAMNDLALALSVLPERRQP